jgi:hypothetical protein
MKTIGYHDHIVNMLGYSIVDQKPVLIVEMCAYGDMLGVLRENARILEQVRNFSSLISRKFQKLSCSDLINALV